MKKLDKKNIEDIFALTPIQEGMLFHYLKNPESEHYFEQLSLETSGKIDREIFENAWNSVVETNEMLRAVFRWEKVENPIQIILKEHKIHLVYYDLPGKETSEKKKRLEEIKSKERQEKFDLHEVPFRVTLCKIEEDRYEMIISNHHILFDGWSSGIILKEFFKAYHDLLNKKKLEKPVKTKYKEFVKWHQDQDIEKQKKFWKDYLKGFEMQTELSIKRRKRKEITAPITENFRASVSRDSKDKIENFVKSHKITLASFLYSAWGILLQQYNSNNDILFDTSVSGRSAKIKGIEHLVGLYINTLPLRVQTYPNEKVLDFLSRTNEMVQQWKAFEGSSPLNIKEYLDEDYRENLFNSVMVIENYPLDKILKQDIHTSILTVNGFSISERTYHDLTVIITTFGDMMIDITYNAALFTERMVKTLVEHFTLILRRMVENPGQNVSMLEISSGKIREIRECIINKYAISPSQSTAEYYAPRDSLEKELVDIWSWIFRVGKKEIGIDTNFLDFGGHSLKAAALRSMIHKRLNVRIPFGQVFKCLTIREQAKFIRELKETRYIPIQPAERKEYYVLSPAQKRIFILQQMEETIVHYNGVEVFILEGNVEREQVENTFKKLIERHESLRTSFELRGETPVQRIHQKVEFKVDYVETGEERVLAIAKDFVKPFQLDQAPLCRVKLLKVKGGEKRFILLVDMHHIIADGISTQVLLEDFQRIYENQNLPGLLLQYKDYANWLSSARQKEILAAREKYWLETFTGELSPLNLYSDYPRPSNQDFKGGTINFNFDERAAQRLSQFAGKTGTTIYMVLLTAFKVLLWKFSGQEDIVTGTAAAGRPHLDLERIVGMFVNTLAIRSFPGPGKTFMQFLDEVKDNFLKAYENQDYPFETLVERLGLQGERSRNPLFDVWVNSPNFGEQGRPGIVFSDIKLTPYKFDNQFTAFDFSLFILEYESHIQLKLEYKESLFKRSTIQYLLGEYVRLVEGILSHPHLKLGEFNIFSRRRISPKTNTIFPVSEYIKFEKEEVNQSITSRFEKQVKKYPDNIAVVSAGGDRFLTYCFLNKYANRIARTIIKTAKDSQTVALLLVHDMGMTAAILGVLKCGRIYTPMDSTYPEARLLYMLEDSEARVILTRGDNIPLAERLRDRANQRIHIIDINAIDDGISDENLGFPVEPDQMAYLLYTSGSTGKPKGIIQGHRNLLHFIRIFTNSCHFNADDRIPLFSNYCFDGAVIEIFLALLNGAALHIYDIKSGDSNERLSEWLEKRKITVFHSIPTFYRYFIESLREEERVSYLRLLMMGGELVCKKDVEAYKKHFSPQCLFFINMGMTETTTNLHYFIDKNTQLDHYFIPLGYPVEETEVLILNEKNEEVSVLGIGELVIKSDYLASGYWKQEERTRKVFTGDPITGQGQVYRTGDLVRLHPDGEIEFIGRKDFQVKIRGFRIELGEIENGLLEHAAIKRVVVVDRRDASGKTSLCGYIVADNPLFPGELKSFLAAKLPDYLIPSYFIQLEELPLTPGGKVDRNSLPGPENFQEKVSATFVAPRTKSGKMIADTWKEILHLDKVGMDDNFFELGGTSLDIIRLQATLRELFQEDITLGDILANPTIRYLAQYYDNDDAGKDISSAAEGSDLTLNAQNESQLGQKIDRSTAVIGMVGRFPGARNIDEFWDNLKAGRETISFFSDDELMEEGTAAGVLQEQNYIKAKGYLGDIEYFDAAFFDYSPREAEVMDPQLRILHECAWEALENAGYHPDSYNGIIGFYIGAGTNLYWMSRFFNRAGSITGADRFAIFNLNSNGSYGTRVAYKLNLKGPGFSVDTACSTSLVSIHLACQGLLNGECHVALAGGISISLPKKHGYHHQEGMIHSSDGHCRAFDADATGTVFGDGVGIVVLKPLTRAVADGDSIYAVIKGSAINNDGSRKVGYTAPGIEGQTRVIQEALGNAGIEPESISYIEAHGTGTALGDPHEIEALTQAFHTEKKGFCKIGSVKTNVGHLDAAAGAAGFIKTVLALKNKLIPPSLHFKTPNPEIDFENTPFSVNTTLMKWERAQEPLRAGVSSFGIGGTNAHAVLEEWPEQAKQPTQGAAKSVTRPQLILLSAKTPTALDKMAWNLADHFKNSPGIDLADAAYTLKVGRKRFNHRRMLVCSTVNEAIERLSGREPENLHSYLWDEESEENSQVVFMFSGQGSQYMNMGLELYQTKAVFREEMDRCLEILNPLIDCDIKEILYPQNSVSKVSRGEHIGNRHACSESNVPATRNSQPAASSEKINQTEVAQPLLFAFEYALVRLLIKWGIKPDAMIGHSIGEYVAACLSGVFSLEDALKLVALRGKLMQEMPPGSMLGVSIPEKKLVPLLDKEISLAAVNSPCECVVSGSFEAIDSFKKQLEERGIKTGRLHTSHAFHSSMMDPILKEFEEGVRSIELYKPRIPYISNLSGNWISVEEAVDPTYWVRHIRQTVRFGDGVKVLLKEKNSIFIEVGPGPTLGTLAKKCMEDHQKQRVVNLVRHPKEDVSDLSFLLNKAGWLWLRGPEIDWEAFHAGEKRCRIPLTTYPFEGRYYWTEENKEGILSASPGEVAGKNKDISNWFYVSSWKRSDLKPVRSDEPGRASDWLVFVREGDFAFKLMQRMVQAGCAIITIKPGPGFTGENDRSYIINPIEPGDYETLINELSKAGRLPGKILHLWNVNEEEDGADETGFFSLLYLAQALGRCKQYFDQKFQITALADRLVDVTGEEQVCPAKAMLLGPIKVIPQEYPGIRCRAVDIILPETGTWQEKKLIDRLFAQLVSEAKEPAAAYRGNNRLVQTIEHVQLETHGEKLKREGVYLITGGLGNIGLTAAEFLAKNWQAKLILTGRSPFPAREEWETWLDTHGPGDQISGKILKVKQIEGLGSEVKIARADVTRLEEMEAVLIEAEKRFGKLNGVLHAAGIAGEESIKSIKEIDKEKCEQIFHARVSGLFVLEKMLKGRAPDFCLLFSSLSSILGGVGLIAYSAANIFMDAFARRQNHQTPFQWISIDWDLWEFEEQKKKIDASSGPGMDLLAMAVKPGEGLEALRRILCHDDGCQFIVSTGELSTRIKKWLELESIFDPGSALPDAAAAPGTSLEQMLTGIWEDYFGIKGIGIHDNFFDLGASSLDLIRLNERLKKIFKKELAIEKLFTYPTIHSLGKFLDEMGYGKTDDEGSSHNDEEMERTEVVIKGKNRLKRRKMSVGNSKEY